MNDRLSSKSNCVNIPLGASHPKHAGEFEPDTHKRLKFLFVSKDKYPLFRVDLTVLFGEEMVKRKGHQIHWILQGKDGCDGSCLTTWSGCQVWVGRTGNGASRLGRLKKHLLDIMHSLKMFKLIPENNYDFIQVKDRLIIALLAIAAAKRNGKKLFYWLSYPLPEADLYDVQEGGARYPWIYILRGMITKILLYHVIMPLSDHVFVQSEQMKKDVSAHGIAGEKLTPVPMGISPGMFPEEPRYTSPDGPLANKAPIILYLGTLVRVRRIDFLLRVMRLVLEDIPEAKLYLVGAGEDPSDIESLQREAQKLNIAESVVFTGFLPRERALEMVSQADVCVSPFYPIPILNSTSPTKLVEYMALGKPVVANDHPEQRLVIQESGAGICVPYDERAFAGAIVQLLGDPSKTELMRRLGREYVANHRTYSGIADRLEERYLSLLKQ